MIKSMVLDKFNELRSDKCGLSSVNTEKLIKDLGFNIARKSLSTLVAYGIIAEPMVVHEGESENSKRVLYGSYSVLDLIAYLLSVDASGMKGRNTTNKLDFYKYAKAEMKDLIRLNTNVLIKARLSSMAVAGAFIDKDLSLQERLEESKQIQEMLLKVILTLWFAVKLFNNTNDVDLVEAWNGIRQVIFNDKVLIRFTAKLHNGLKESENSLVSVTHIMEILKDNDEAKKDLLALFEILMVYSTDTNLIAFEIEAYMFKKHGLSLNLHDDRVFKVMALYKLIK